VCDEISNEYAHSTRRYDPIAPVTTHRLPILTREEVRHLAPLSIIKQDEMMPRSVFVVIECDELDAAGFIPHSDYTVSLDKIITHERA